MFSSVRIAVDAYEHFGALIQLRVFKYIAPVSVVSALQLLSLAVAVQHSRDDVIGAEDRGLLRLTWGYRTQRKQQDKDALNSHDQNSMTNFPRYSRHELLKKPPNLALSSMVCTSRGLN